VVSHLLKPLSPEEEAQLPQLLNDPNLSPEDKARLTLLVTIKKQKTIDAASMQKLIALDPAPLGEAGAPLQELVTHYSKEYPQIANQLSGAKNTGDVLLILAQASGQPGINETFLNAFSSKAK
jgi:hypothetical protein